MTEQAMAESVTQIEIDQRVYGLSRVAAGRRMVVTGSRVAGMRYQALVGSQPCRRDHAGIVASPVAGAAPRPAWTYRGEPPPFLPPAGDGCPPAHASPENPVELTPMFLKSLENRGAVEAAAIAVERIRGPNDAARSLDCRRRRIRSFIRSGAWRWRSAGRRLATPPRPRIPGPACSTSCARPSPRGSNPGAPGRPSRTDFMAEYGPFPRVPARPNPYAIRQRPPRHCRHAQSCRVHYSSERRI